MPQPSILPDLDMPETPSMPLGDMRTTLGQSMGSVVANAWQDKAGALAMWGERQYDKTTDADLIDPTSATEQMRDLNMKFDQPVSQRYLDLAREVKVSHLTNQAIINQSPQGVLPEIARFGAGMLDPINLVTLPILPAVGPAEMVLGYAAKAGVASEGVLGAFGGRTVTRALQGAEAGLLGAAVTEPVNKAVASELQDDYTYLDTVRNIVGGVLLGSGLQAGVGALGDFVKNLGMFRAGEAKAPTPRNIPEALANAPHEVKQDALMQAVIQAQQGQDVNITNQLRRMPQRPGQPLLGSVQSLVDASGNETNVRYELMEMADLKAANDGLPYDKGGIGLYVQDLSHQMNPERLGDSVHLNNGAPVVDADGKIVGERPEVMALGRAYSHDLAAAKNYREYLRMRLGDENGAAASETMTEPVLVRRMVPRDEPQPVGRIGVEVPKNVARETGRPMRPEARQELPPELSNPSPAGDNLPAAGEEAPAFDRNNLKHVQRVVGADTKVTSLVQWVKDQGGIHFNEADMRGELNTLTNGRKGLKLRLNNKEGARSLDAMARDAEVEGYISGRNGEMAGPNDLIEALGREADGEKIYTRTVQDKINASDEAFNAMQNAYYERVYGGMANDMPVVADSFMGDPLTSPEQMQEATGWLQVESAKPLEAIDEDMQRLESMGGPSQAEKDALAHADEMINAQPNLREALMAAAKCVLGNE